MLHYTLFRNLIFFFVISTIMIVAMKMSKKKSKMTRKKKLNGSQEVRLFVNGTSAREAEIEKWTTRERAGCTYWK